MIDSYKDSYSVDELDDLREIYSYIAKNSLFRILLALGWGVFEKKFVHWISCQLAMC